MLLAQSGLIACYVVTAALLVLMAIYSHWPWVIKLVMVIIMFCFYLLSYFSFPPLLGWPTSETIPDRFKLVSEMVKEPNKAKGTSGEIYLWVTDVQSTSDNVEPRAYRIPYSAKLHKMVIEAGNKARKGVPQIGEVSDGNDFDMLQPTDAYQGGDVSDALEFFDLPETVLPDK